MGSGQCLSELVLTVFLLPMSVRGNLLMSAWTEPECFSCQYFLVISIGVLPEVFPSVFCQICLKGSLDVFLDQPKIFLACICLMGLISVCRAGSHLSLSANICCEEPADVYLN